MRKCFGFQSQQAEDKIDTFPFSKWKQMRRSRREIYRSTQIPQLSTSILNRNFAAVKVTSSE